MSDTFKRDQVAALAKTSIKQAIAKARSIEEPWFRAQALAWVARFSPANAVELAAEASLAARKCDDAYKRVAVRAWEIAALAETECTAEVTKSLADSLRDSVNVVPSASRAEALVLLLQAAVRIGAAERDRVHVVLTGACNTDKHWRSKRALRDAEAICNGSRPARKFFW